MIIGLMGFEFSSPNKGCEALSYSFLSILKNISNGDIKEIIYFSNDPNMGNIKKHFPQFNFTCVPRRLKDIHFLMIKAFIKCDVVFDVTMGDSFSDIYSETHCLNDIKFKRIAEFFNKKYILLPQTYGPFENIKIKKKVSKVIKDSYAIFCRDELSQKLLLELCPSIKTYLMTDMAFVLPYDKNKYQLKTNKIKLGINVSGLLWRGGFGKENQFSMSFDYKNYINEIIRIYCEYEKVQVYLIPHVIDEKTEAHDDDYRVSKLLNNLYPSTICAPKFNTPIEAKSYISNMDCFIGSRMHSTIAAFSSKVAVIPVSYSRKFEGLFNSVGYNYLIHGNKDSLEEAVQKTVRYITKYSELKKEVEKDCSLVDKYINDLTILIKTIVRND